MTHVEENQLEEVWCENNEFIFHSKFPLHRACRDGDVQALSFLLKSGSHSLLEEDTFYGWTPSHWAAYFGKFDCLQKVISGDPSTVYIDIKSSKFLQTPTHIASFADHSRCLLWLLQVGANVNSQDYLGETPLHKAARTGSMECVTLLSAMGADVRITNNNGQTPTSLATMCGHHAVASFLGETEPRMAQNSMGVNGNSDMFPERNLTNGIYQNGFHLNGSAGMNGIFKDSRQDMMETGNSDGNLSHSVTMNHLPILGRKRSFEGLEEAESKRMRTEGPFVIRGLMQYPLENAAATRGVTFFGNPNSINNNNCQILPCNVSIVNAPNSSVLEHLSLRQHEQGYNHIFMESMISQIHGC
ncbi:ankyrin repeat domain-containing protein 10-like [Limulus polyphemus]|uniref:Ankyrin repeat domain-containing protein 10-like n=1 Tax=Limulus polyphemus TaxID=6850 RepID=A0ABM1SB94_LIMPO|nr:ankyrin repeat domain-containing protein 10-like [Limulus polyphemus]